jgi:hypothetical protein
MWRAYDALCSIKKLILESREAFFFTSNVSGVLVSYYDAQHFSHGAPHLVGALHILVTAHHILVSAHLTAHHILVAAHNILL